MYLQPSTTAIHTLRKIDSLSEALLQYSIFHDVNRCFVTLVKAGFGGGSIRKVIGLVIPSLEHPLNALIGNTIQVTEEHSFLLEYLLPSVNKVGWGVPIPRPLRETQIEHWHNSNADSEQEAVSRPITPMPYFYRDRTATNSLSLKSTPTLGRSSVEKNRLVSTVPF